jgi:hypothetical protein
MSPLHPIVFCEQYRLPFCNLVKIYLQHLFKHLVLLYTRFFRLAPVLWANHEPFTNFDSDRGAGR